EVWRWNGTTWLKIGGDSLNSGWGAGFEAVRSMRNIAGTVYAGLGDSAGDADLWSWNGTTWSQVGGDGISGSWSANYEGIYAIGTDGTDIYAGLGTGNGDGEVWRLSSGTWSQIGGDGVNGSWATNFGDTVYALPSNGTTVYAGIYDTAGGGYLYSWDGSAWTALGGQYINNSWGYYGQGSVEVLQVSGESLYAGIGSAAGSAQIWRLNGSSWSLIGGQGVNNSWAPNTYDQISSMSSHEGNLYVGLGITAGEAEVWMWNGSTWSQIGGDGVSGGWNAVYEEVNSLASFNGNLYAGLGNSNSDAEVWMWDGTIWDKIGGDGESSSWGANYDRVSSMAIYKGNLIAGLGGTAAGEAELWQWDGTIWDKIGGDVENSSWDSTFEQVESLIQFNNRLYVGLGNGAGDGEVWELNDTTWTKIGGDDLNNSWADGTYERVRTLATYNGDLYAGLGSSTGEGEVWKYSNGNWEKVGGNSVNTSWANTMEEVESFSTYQGKLYAGTGNTANADATVWSLGDNGYLQSTTSSFNTDWRHIAATYDGSTMKLYIDGVQNSSLSKTFSVATSNRDLRIGTGYGGREYGKPQARFQGLIDEVRLSDVSRSSFTTKPYATSPQTLQPQESTRKNGVWHWDTLSHTEIPSGGTITYRLSADEGATWLYWDGSSWVESSNSAEANTVAVITDNFDEFPVTFGGMLWQAMFTGNGNQRVTLDGVNAEATSDTTDPTNNPSNIVAHKANGGTVFAQNDWTNGGSPYFTWDPGDDDESEIKGYCAYVGTDQTANPITTKGLLGTSPESTGGNCQFMVAGASLDLATPGILQTALSTSNDTYYLTLRSIDNAGNVSNSSSQFSFRFDNTAPSNPGYITAPSGFINTKDVSLSWPTSGGNAPSDSNSGMAGLQYRIGPSGTWYGDSHTGLGNMADMLPNDGEYTTHDPTDYANLVEGINTVYFRTWDQAGNVT
ncbi:MAG: LamG-like jellyroll fold domain-containing protein, partial [Candidatus Saccharimonadales bacterium]